MSLEQVKEQIDKVARSSGFRCMPVSWEDAQRGTVGGALSCWGSNISDVRLWEKSGKLLYTVRSDNWNERLGYVSAKDVALVVGNEVSGGSDLKNVTLQSYLSNAKKYGSYAGLSTESLSENQTDQIFSIRFQTVFLPVQGDEGSNVDDIPPEKLGRVEFCTDVYNYNTHSDDNPRNALLLCTAQGTSLQQDGHGTKKMFIHEVDPSNKIHRYWLEAERSKHKVGGAQKETQEEAEAAAARGKAVATFIGTRAMGTRFNVQMLIQLPVKQKPTPAAVASYDFWSTPPSQEQNDEYFLKLMREAAEAEEAARAEEALYRRWSWCPTFLRRARCLSCCPCYFVRKNVCFDANTKYAAELFDGATYDEVLQTYDPSISNSFAFARPPQPPAIGVSNAARVSRGTEEDVWSGLSKKELERDSSQHGTITVTMYYTVVGGIPSEADVLAAIEDLNSLYKSCPSDKKLIDCTEITSELTVKNMQDIKTKVTTQGYQPPVKTYTPYVPADDGLIDL